MEIGQVTAYKRWSNRYSYAFKMEVIEAFQSGQMSQRQITRKYNIGRPTILAWQKKYSNLEKNHINISMTTKHDPYENAVAERINGTLKYEFDLGDRLPDLKHAEREINKSVWIYNNLRPHESCNYLTPLQTHLQESIKVKKWPVRFKKNRDQKNITLNQLFLT